MLFHGSVGYLLLLLSSSPLYDLPQFVLLSCFQFRVITSKVAIEIHAD